MTDIDAGTPRWEANLAIVTTFRRDGTPVSTPMEPLIEGGRIYFITNADTGKVMRLRRDVRVTVVPTTLRGEALGPTQAGRVRILEGAEVARVNAAFRQRRFWGWLMMSVRALVKQTRRVFIEVTLDPSGL